MSVAPPEFQYPSTPAPQAKKKKGLFDGFNAKDPLQLAMLLAPLAEILKHGAGSHLFDTAVKGQIGQAEQKRLSDERQVELDYRRQQADRHQANIDREHAMRVKQGDIATEDSRTTALGHLIESQRKSGLPVDPATLSAYEAAVAKQAGTPGAQLFPRRTVPTVTESAPAPAPDQGVAGTAFQTTGQAQQPFLPRPQAAPTLATVDPQTFGPQGPGAGMGHLPAPTHPDGQTDSTAISLIRQRVLAETHKGPTSAVIVDQTGKTLRTVPLAPGQTIHVVPPAKPDSPMEDVVVLDPQTGKEVRRFTVPKGTQIRILPEPSQAGAVESRAIARETRTEARTITREERVAQQRLQREFDTADRLTREANAAFVAAHQANGGVGDPKAIQAAERQQAIAFARYQRAKEALRNQPVTSVPPAPSRQPAPTRTPTQTPTLNRLRLNLPPLPPP